MPFDSLEYVVRPYVTPNAHGQIIIPSAPRGSHERATLTWSGAAEVPAPQEISDGVNFEVVCCQEGLNESSRENTIERIAQQTNPDNWVDVARAASLKLKKKESNKCGDDWSQISWVAQEIDAELAVYSADIHSGTASGTQNCSVGWTFKNTQ
jgi:hypothetical protein